ncbi:hypothetical protein [Bradyrhizobium neotropicale]|uniref:YD repeat-containing protein n=1 Tax=Bradyrhizobium neotropicale TaxID=1497615 RepID=A0A176YVF2_9BRAD|nr:hypothetical protein [Bradyrhizobium neotropicale]OAF11690.1 hypothetical protein AXW67_21710 [Bradyrhizobium neotropicale]
MSFAVGTPISDANPLPTRVAGQLLDNMGQPITPDNYTQNFTYNTDGTLASISFTDGTNTWTQNYTYNAGNVASVSRWVRS